MLTVAGLRAQAERKHYAVLIVEKEERERHSYIVLVSFLRRKENYRPSKKLKRGRALKPKRKDASKHSSKESAKNSVG